MLNAQSIREKITAVLADVSKDDDKATTFQLANIDKGTLLLETRIFNESPLNVGKCFDTLSKLMYLLITKGVVLAPAEESDLFFGITKLFQPSSRKLRRMVYLAIKTLNIGEGEAFIVTSSLAKDITSGSDVHRANAIRVLSKVVDASLDTQIERYLKTAIVDKSPFVASAALVCAMSILKTCPEVVKRWVNEAMDSVKSKSTTVQFHALALLYELKKTDRLALHKVIETLTVTPLKSPLAECLLIRYATRVIKAEREPTLEKNIMDYLDARLRHRSEVVVLEAARALCCLATDNTILSERPSAPDMTPALNGNDMLFLEIPSALQVMLCSSRPVVRFSSIRTLNQLAETSPQWVSQCNSEIETLLTDSNRSVATLALTTLLKTGDEAGVERLIKQITSLLSGSAAAMSRAIFLVDVSDMSRIEIIRAVHQLASTYPAKHALVLSFLATQLRDEGSFEVKRELVEALATLIQQIPEALGPGLLHFCEFIEDCEYPVLCTKVLTLIGTLAPRTATASKYIRFIYNRIILENAAVRASAVDALTKLGYACPSVRTDVATLLERENEGVTFTIVFSCLIDTDDEIRDRTRLYYKALVQDIANNDDTASVSTTATGPALDEVLTEEAPVALDALLGYTRNWINSFKTEGESIPFDLSSLPTEEEFRRMQELAKAGEATIKAASTSLAPQVGLKSVEKLDISTTASDLQSVCSTLCPLLEIGSLDHSCRPIHLTEREAEYSVACMKHMFDGDVLLLEFQVTNTMADQVLQSVEIVPHSFDNTTWRLCGASRIESLPYDMPTSAYAIMQQITEPPLDSTTMPEGTFPVNMKFIVKEADDDLGYEDSYSLEQINVSVADSLIPRSLRPGQFKTQWNVIGDYSEATAKISLSFSSVEETVDALLDMLNLAPCENSHKNLEGRGTTELMLSGTMTRGSPILCRCLIVQSPNHGSLVKIVCRSKYPEVSEKILTVFD